MRKDALILAGDVGGTKTVLALVTADGNVKAPVREERFECRSFDSLESIIARFLEGEPMSPMAATFGVAGPVFGRTAKITNLPWTIDADAIGRAFAILHVHLLNDLEAVATAVPHMAEDDLLCLHPGTAQPEGVKAVIAPGTGLGQAYLVWTGSRYTACPTEGGHASFAPVSPEQVALLAHLERRFGHVSFERVCSGSGIANLYDFVRASGLDEPAWLRQELSAAVDPTPIIVSAALERRVPVCEATLDLFVRNLGGAIGNMALTVFATGGIYLGGGIPPRILSRLQQPDFLASIRHKGRFGDWLESLPIWMIRDPKAALHGAAWDGIEALSA